MSFESPVPPTPVFRPTSVNAGAVVRSDFARVRRGGFDPDQVVEHLRRVANHISDLEARISDLEGKVGEREHATASEKTLRNEVYQSVGARVADLVRAFDEEMERVRANAYAEADNRLAEARAHADRIEREAEKVRAEAERTADELMSNIDSRRAGLLEDVRRIHEALQRSAALAASILDRNARDVVIVDEAPAREP